MSYFKHIQPEMLSLTSHAMLGSHNDTGGQGEELPCTHDACAVIAGHPDPVGSVFISVNETDPATTLEYGLWELIRSGRLLGGSTILYAWKRVA